VTAEKSSGSRCTLCVHNGAVAAIVRLPVRATYSSNRPWGKRQLACVCIASDSCCCGCCGRKLIVKDVIVYFISRPRVVAAHTPDFKRPALFYIRLLAGCRLSMNTFIACGVVAEYQPPLHGCRRRDVFEPKAPPALRLDSTDLSPCRYFFTRAVSLLSCEKRPK
jgi:hypothetical protein